MKRLLTLLILLENLIFIGKVYSQSEFEVFDGVLNWTDTRTETRQYGFYYLPAPVYAPSDWSAFWNGNFYFRYEIISQPAEDSCLLQYCIYENFPAEPYYGSCAEQNTLHGTASIDTSKSSPSAWWCDGAGCVDFSDPSAFSKFPVVLWSAEHGRRIYQGDAEMWAIRSHFLPMQVRVTIVAVAQGETFSGWIHWLTHDKPPVPVPNYSIDFLKEETHEIVTSVYEYSFDSAVWNPGPDDYLALVPGQDVYFRAADDHLVTQTLIVPSRPGLPDFSIDYPEESTAEIVTSEFEASDNPDLSDSIIGNGDTLALVPGIDKYFRRRATDTTFASDIQHLVVPERPEAPSFGISFAKEMTDTVVADSIEYSFNSDFSDAVSGNDSLLAVIPGTDLYFRAKATTGSFASFVLHLDVPPRPSSPAYAIDYFNERIADTIPAFVAYSLYPDMSDSIAGNDSILDITPGIDLYLMVMVTDSTFRSEISHLVIPERPQAPDFSIDTNFFKTNEVADSTHEYSTDQLLWESGIGEVISLIPDSDIYFRIKATAETFMSFIQHLVVPEVSMPAYTIDFTGEQTGEPLESYVEYSLDEADWTVGQGAKLVLTPGQDIYIRKLVDTTKQQLLEVPPRPPVPAFMIDFANERTATAVSSLFEYSAYMDMSGALDGTGTYVPLIPGTDIFFRKKVTDSSFRSDVQHIELPIRPDTPPEFSISFLTEMTNEVISDSIEYSADSTMSTPVAGTGSAISLIPGTDVYFRIKSTDSSFASGTILLEVPSRPVQPTVTIDFFNETTVQPIQPDIEFSAYSNLMQPVDGSGVKLNLIPGEDIYFRYKATIEFFSSEILHLDVSDRPSTPVFTIDFVNEKTTEPVSSMVQYSTNSDFSSYNTGNGSNLNLVPGVTLYFRKPATSGSFISGTSYLTVPLRPIITSAERDSTMKDTFSVNISFAGEVIGFTAEDILVTNGTATNLQGTYHADIVPSENGIVTVKVPADVIDGGNLVSNTFIIKYIGDVTGLDDLGSESEPFLYPNPCKEAIWLFIPDEMRTSKLSVEVYNIDGQPVLNFIASESNMIDMSSQQKGSYLIKINSGLQSWTYKLILE
ncbi:MAG: T9SS type A sorting domain-containing protein [Bacteroidales bacterium]|nr:T9SS type A sorting domain-containing protein [Bacteroidales bacterium]